MESISPQADAPRGARTRKRSRTRRDLRRHPRRTRVHLSGRNAARRSMLKMYHRHHEAGSSAAYWEAFGGEQPLAEHLRFCDVDPLRPLFTRVLGPGAVMLE